MLFGVSSASQVKNWYVYTPVPKGGQPAAPEPAAATGPAPIVPTDLTNCHVLVVDGNWTGNAAWDPWLLSNPSYPNFSHTSGTVVDATTYSTLQAAINALGNESSYYASATNTVTMKTVILVTPDSIGTWPNVTEQAYQTYNAVNGYYTVSIDGTPSCPLVIEGVPDSSGNLPAIDGSTPITASWSSTNWSNVYSSGVYSFRKLGDRRHL